MAVAIGNPTNTRVDVPPRVRGAKRQWLKEERRIGWDYATAVPVLGVAGSRSSSAFVAKGRVPCAGGSVHPTPVTTGFGHAGWHGRRMKVGHDDTTRKRSVSRVFQSCHPSGRALRRGSRHDGGAGVSVRDVGRGPGSLPSVCRPPRRCCAAGSGARWSMGFGERRRCCPSRTTFPIPRPKRS